jgi:hypothetical protein
VARCNSEPSARRNTGVRVNLNLTWIGVALVLPLMLGVLVAWPFWLKRVRDDIGTITGAGVILLFAVFFIAREYGEVEAITRGCVAENVGCRFHPQPFVRYAIYAAIGTGQVFALFLSGLAVEEHLRNREQQRQAGR